MKKCRCCRKLTENDGLCNGCCNRFSRLNDELKAEFEAQRAKWKAERGKAAVERKRERVKRRYWGHPFVRLAKAIKKGDKSSTITAQDIRHKYKQQRGLCAISKRKLTNQNLSPDHITPKVKGGTSTIENIQLVCREVNIAKNSLTMDDFLSLCRDIIRANG
jgi:5-methylcytosine-specific restriction endonuclease McrA